MYIVKISDEVQHKAQLKQDEYHKKALRENSSGNVWEMVVQKLIHVLCMETLLCAAVCTASCQHGLEELVLCMETVLCAAVDTASHQHGLEACTVYGDCTVCSCRHSKSTA